MYSVISNILDLVCSAEVFITKLKGRRKALFRAILRSLLPSNFVDPSLMRLI